MAAESSPDQGATAPEPSEADLDPKIMDDALEAAKAAIRPLREMSAPTGRLAYKALKAALPHILRARAAALRAGTPSDDDHFTAEELTRWRDRAMRAETALAAGTADAALREAAEGLLDALASEPLPLLATSAETKLRLALGAARCPASPQEPNDA